MVVRQDQIAVFSNHSNRKFEDSMVRHLNENFPSWSASAGECAVRETVRRGIRQSSTYGITSQRDVCRYVDLMVVFGNDFDHDPQLPWASRILNDAFYRDPTTKTEALHDEAMRQRRTTRTRA